MTGFVYFVSDGAGRLKIGFSRAPTERLRALRTAHGGTLTLLGSVPGTLEFERELHERFASLRLSGEWFRAEPDLLAAVDSLLAAPQLPLSTAKKPKRERRSPEIDAYGERILAYLKEKHPTRTAENVAADTGLSVSAVSKWFERASLPNGDATVQLLAAYGPTFFAAAVGSETPEWVREAVTVERASEIVEQINALLLELENLDPRFSRPACTSYQVGRRRDAD